VLSKVLHDLPEIFAGWPLGNFCISLFKRRDVQAHVLVVLFPSDLMLVARGLCGEKYSLSY
jgi:hypothetical protein